MFCPSETVWVIGGAQIYAQALPLAERVEVTEIAQDFDGDARAGAGPEWLQPRARTTPVPAACVQLCELCAPCLSARTPALARFFIDSIQCWKNQGYRPKT